MTSILAFSFHPAFFPPKSGGEHRLYNIYKYLSNYYDITLVSFTHQNKFEIVEHNKNFKEIRIPKTKLSQLLHYLVDKFSNIKECSAIITSIESRFNKNFKKVIENRLYSTDIIIFVYPYLFTVPKSLLKNKRIIYESHNIEYELMKQSLFNSLIGKLLLKYVYYMEKSLSRISHLIFVVSEEDKERLSKIYDIDKNKIYVSKNGVNPNKYDDIIQENKKKNHNICLFVGSYHPPNIEAIENITAIARRLPDIYFIIAGNVSQYFINYTSDLIESQYFINYTSDLIKSKIVSFVDGFYNLEFWDSIPTVWTKQYFKIHISEEFNEEFNLIELKIYSPAIQRLEVKSNKEVIYFKLKNGWNSIKIPNKKNLLIFHCEKILTDNKRELGIAVQEVIYHTVDQKFDCDLRQSLQKLYTFKANKNVFLMGQVADEEILELYRMSDVALNPMLSGSGTNIKMLDYMAAGLPVITTPTGARGLDIENYNNALVCDILGFPEKIEEVLSKKDLYDKLSHNGRKLVEEKYDWKKIAEDMARTLEENS